MMLQFRGGLYIIRVMQQTCTDTIHASCVAMPRGPFAWAGFGSAGILLLGPSASGKSDLALRLIDRGARLIADDRVVLTIKHGKLLASPPDQLRGLMEVRGLGIIATRSRRRATVALAVRLVKDGPIERFPDPVGRFDHDTIGVPMIDIDPFEASAPAKIAAALISTCQLGSSLAEPGVAVQRVVS